MPRARLQRFIDSFSIKSLGVWKNHDGGFRPATKPDRDMTEVMRGLKSQSYREVTLALEVQPMLHPSFVAVSGLGEGEEPIRRLFCWFGSQFGLLRVGQASVQRLS